MKRPEFGLLVASTLFSLAVALLSLEAYERYEFQQWLDRLPPEGRRFLGGLTVASPDPTLIWEYRPNGTYESPTGGYSIHTNRFGFRGPDVSMEKPAGRIRHAVVGDSVALGYGVDDDETFSARLQRYADLQQSGQEPAEILNFGVDGYSALQIGGLVRTKVLEFQPDSVIYVLCLNDFDFADSSGWKIDYFRKPTFFFLRSLQRWRFRLSGKDYHDYYYDRNKETVFGEIEAMQRLLATRGIDFEVVIVPLFYPSEDGFTRYPFLEPHAEINAWLDARGIDHLDLLEVFQDQGAAPDQLASDHWHPNRRGHALIADALIPDLFSSER